MVPKIPDTSLPVPFGLLSRPNYCLSFEGCTEREKERRRWLICECTDVASPSSREEKRAFDVRVLRPINYKFFFYMYRMDSFLLLKEQFSHMFCSFPACFILLVLEFVDDFALCLQSPMNVL